MRKRLIGATILGTGVVLGFTGTAKADLTVEPNDGTAFTIAEAGGSGPGTGIPVGTMGYIGSANLVADVAGPYKFTYEGAGDSVDLNQFTVMGHTFCSQPGLPACGGAATPFGTSFTVNLPIGDVPYTFVASVENSGGVTLGNSDPAGDPPYQASVFTSLPFGNCIAAPDARTTPLPELHLRVPWADGSSGQRYDRGPRFSRPERPGEGGARTG